MEHSWLTICVSLLAVPKNSQLKDDEDRGEEFDFGVSIQC